MKGMKNNKDDQKVFFFCTRREKKTDGRKKRQKTRETTEGEHFSWDYRELKSSDSRKS